jgi:energy-coupling factor transporter ATP-binding protein EcfA2
MSNPPGIPRKAEAQQEIKAMQYAQSGGAYVRSGPTTQALQPGFYDVVNTGMAGYGLKPKAAVSDDLIDIPGTVADEIFSDIETFMATGERYRQFGLTHKRGYLFYGPPGSGKTSLAMMLARRFIEKVGGIVMYAGGVGEFYHGVSIMRDVEPGRPSMYLIEEADEIVNNTYCLSILDGELSIQGAVFVAMTNYKSKLPPRIANRPGRFDRVTMVNSPPEAVQIEYLKRVAARGDVNEQVAVNIVKALSGVTLSMAHLREAFISHVLMGVSLPDLRLRFEIMSGQRNENGELTELFAGVAAVAGAKADDDVEQSDEDWEREDRLDQARHWSPDD